MKKLSIILIVALLFGTAWARTGNVYHEVQVYDEVGNKVTDITTLYIYAPDTTTDAVIYSDRGLQNVITIPMTESSTNTTLVDGFFSWYGPDGWDFSMTNTDGVGPATNSGHATRTSSEGSIVFPSYLQSISSTTYTDAQTITLGTGADWVLSAGTVADTFTAVPASDNSAFNIGVSGTTLNSDFNIFVGTALGLKLDAGVPSLTWDGGAVLLNHNSNFNVGINTGTSTGTTTIGSSTSGALALETTAGLTILADDASTIKTSAGTLLIEVTGGDLTIDSPDKSILIDGGEAAADAVTITATGTAGGIDITSLGDIDITTTGAAGEDITITNTGGSINITATEADAGAITIQASAAGGDLNLDSVLGRIEIEAEEDVANAIYIIADGGTSSTVKIHADTGTGDESIFLASDAGGITVNAAAGSVDIEAVGATAGDIGINAGDDMTVTVAGNLAYAVTGTTIFTNEVSSTAGLQSGAVTVTATADGLTTGLIPSGTAFVTVTSDTATKVVVLPASVIGNVIWITVPATGCELQTLATTNETINTVDCDGTNELALVAGSIYRLVCTKAITWVATGASNVGANEDSLTPDAD